MKKSEHVSPIIHKLQVQFKQWRATRLHMRDRIPQHLRQAVQNALKHHKAAEVTKAINYNANRIMASPTNINQPPSSADFVPLGPLSLAEPSGPILEFETKDGLKVRFLRNYPGLLDTREILEFLMNRCSK